MKIWALLGPGKNNDDWEENRRFIRDSAKEGLSRFGWSCGDGYDLHRLDPMDWKDMSGTETEYYKKARRLLDVEPGDWIVHINVPEYGQCTVAQATGTYQFTREPSHTDDFRHAIPVDSDSVLSFDRKDGNILPEIQASLCKPRRALERIYSHDAFMESLTNLRENRHKRDEGSGLSYLRRDAESHLAGITELIHKNFPRENLETFMARVFRNIPGIEVQEIGGRGEKGADLLVTRVIDSPLEGIPAREELMVVQIKSFAGEHWETGAVDQVVQAIKHYEADYGMLITTAEATEQLNNYADEQSETIGKPIHLCAGADVAKFVLRYNPDLLW